MSNRAARRAAAAKERHAAPSPAPAATPVRMDAEAAAAGVRRRSKIDVERLRKELSTAEGNFDQAMEHFLDEMAEAVNVAHHCEGTEEERSQVWAAVTERLNPDLKAIIVRSGWRQVTDEGLEKIVAEEVVDRAFLRTDLTYLLSLIDNLALAAIRNELGDNTALVLESVQKQIGAYLTEDKDQTFSRMRDRLAGAGWHDVPADGFATEVAREAVSRIPDLKAGTEDTVVDERLNSLPQAEQDRHIAKFRERLNIEYLGLHRGDVREGEGYRARSARKALAGAIAPLEIDEKRKALAEVSKIVNRPDRRPGAFERDLMRWGSGIWNATYKRGYSDAEAHEHALKMAQSITKDKDLAAIMNAGPIDVLLMFSAAWAVHAYQRITTSHTFAAALMCSDADRDSLEAIETQWKAFLVQVPNGVLVAKGEDGIERDFSRILVGMYDFGTVLLLCVPDSSATTPLYAKGSTGGTIADVLMVAEGESQGTEEERVVVMAKRLVAGLLLSLQHQDNFRERQVPPRSAGPGRGEEEPGHRIVMVGRPLQVDCRDSVRKYLRSGVGKSGRKNAPPSVQTLVRGHYRRQVVGIGRSGRKVIWIVPFWRGPIGAPILTRPKAVGPGGGQERS